MWQQRAALQRGDGINAKTNQELTENVRLFFDSQPKRDVTIDPRDHVVHTARTLLQVMGDASRKIAFVIADRIVDPFASWINQVLPSLYTDRTSIQVLVEEDKPHIAHDVPFWGTVRRVQTTGYQYHIELSQKGLGMEMELIRFLAAGGRQMYLRKLNQISNAVQRRTYISTIEALLTSKLREEKRLRMAPSHFSLGTLAQIEVSNFCASCWGDGDMVMRKRYMAASARILQRAGVLPDVAIIGPNTQSRLVDQKPGVRIRFIGQGMDPKDPAMMEYLSQEPVPTAFPDNVSIYIDRGLTLEDGAPPVQLLVNDVSMMEFGVAGMENILSQLDCTETERFCTSKTNISLSDMGGNRGGFVSMDAIEMMANQYLWGNPELFGDPGSPDGKFGWYEEAMGDMVEDDGEHIDEDYWHAAQATLRTAYMVRFNELNARLTQKPLNRQLSYLEYQDGQVARWVRVMGQIAPKDWTHEKFLKYARASLNVAYPTSESRAAATAGLNAYIQLCENIEGQPISRTQVLEWVNGLFAVNRSVYDNNGLRELGANQHGSLNLPGADPNVTLVEYPIGYNNAGGCVTIFHTGEATYPKAHALAKNAALFLLDVFAKANMHLGSSRSVEVDLAPRTYQAGARGAYALAMAITKHRPAMWVRVPGTGTRSGQAETSLGTAFAPIATVDNARLPTTPFALFRNEYVIAIGDNQVLTIQNVPLIYFDHVAGAKITNYTRALAMMGSRTHLKYQNILRILPDDVRNLFYDTVVYLGKKDGIASSFQLARAFVDGFTISNGANAARDLVKSLSVLTVRDKTVFNTPTEKRKWIAENGSNRKKAEEVIEKLQRSYDNKDDTNRGNPFWMQLHSPLAHEEFESDLGRKLLRKLETSVKNEKRTRTIRFAPLMDPVTKKDIPRPWMNSMPTEVRFGEGIDATTDDGAAIFYRTPLTFHPNLIEVALIPDTDILMAPSEPGTDDQTPLDPRGPYQDTNQLLQHPDYAPMGASTGGYQSNVHAGDLPGIRTAELRFTFSRFGRTTNPALHSRIDDCIQKCADPLLRLWATAYALTSIEEWDQVKSLMTNNTPLPMHSVPLYPRIIQQTESGILMVRGPQTGANWFSNPHYATGMNPNNKYVVGNFTVMTASMVHGEKRVEVMYHVSPVAIEGGANTDYYPFPDYWAHDGGEVQQSLILQMAGPSRPSLLVLSASPSEAYKIPGGFDIAGRTQQERMTNMNDRVEAISGRGFNVDGTRRREFQLSTTAYHKKIWKWNKLIEGGAGHFGTWAYQTHQGVYDRETCKLMPTVFSKSPRKTGYGTGSVDVWNGDGKTFGHFNILANAVNP